MFGTHDEGGRTGLSQVKVTPLVYLQLQHSLETGSKVTHNRRPLLYNDTQLRMAFSHYLRENKGPWNRSETMDLARLDKLAEKIVEKDLQKVGEQRKKDQKQGLSFQASKKKEFILLQKLGLLPEPEKNEAGEDDDIRIEAFPQEAKGVHLFREALTAESVVELLSAVGEPTATVAMSLFLIGMKSELTDAVFEFLLKTYEHDAKNAPEKEIVSDALIEMPENLRLQQSQEIDKLYNRENDAAFREKLHEAKGPHAEESEKDRLHRQFSENETMTKIPVFTKPDTTLAKQSKLDNPLALPDLNAGPSFKRYYPEKDQEKDRT